MKNESLPENTIDVLKRLVASQNLAPEDFPLHVRKQLGDFGDLPPAQISEEAADVIGRLLSNGSLSPDDVADRVRDQFVAITPLPKEFKEQGSACQAKGLWDVEQVAQYLGVSISTVRSWVSRGKIPFYKVGSLVKFKPEDIDAWLESNKSK